MGKKNRVAVICGWLMFVVLSPGYALGQQQDLISLKVSDVPFVKVLEEIRKQSGYNFMYNEKFTRNVGRITLEVKNLPLETVMEKVLKGTGLNFRIQDNIIILQENRVEQPRFRTLRGTVRDENGEPIPGVTVLIKGTLIGVSTAIDGSFTLDLPGETEVLQISFIGMETQEIKISPQMNELNVVMRPHISELEEVIVSTGYTQTAKWRATGSVAVVDKKVFENKALPTMDKLLQGQIAGVSVQARSGRPGESAKIRIRGTNTITGNAEPLWVVDGVPLQKNIPLISTGQIKAGDFSDIFTNGVAGINPNDIENVTILKDAAAAAIYGSRAAGGVIVVTTKTGKSGKMAVN